MKKKLFQLVILAGGLGTRIKPLTYTEPKALASSKGIPFIEHQLRLLKQQNINDVLICVGYLGEKIKDHIKDGHQFGLNVTYSFDGETLLGTAGAIRKAFSLLAENFFVLYGDSYLTCDYSAVQKSFEESGKKSLMTVFHNAGQWDKSNVEFNNHCLLKYDKKNQTGNMHHIDYGLGVFNKSVFANLALDQYYDLAQLYQDLLSENQLAGFEVKERFYEVGSFSGIKELENII